MTIRDDNLSRGDADARIGAAPDDGGRPSPRGLDLLVTSLIGPVFLALAAWFVLWPREASIPHREPINVPASSVSSAPLRQLRTGPPVIRSGGYDLKCMECHRLFSTDGRSPRRLMQHRDIVLDHGLNDRCLNCHDSANRNLLRIADGPTLTFAEAPQLCARCHGTTYRDWEQGMHGRTVGSWDEQREGRRRLMCTECHDPHAPAFGPMTPLPGPNTLRMPAAPSHDATPMNGKRNPLRQWSSPTGDRARDDEHRKEHP
jgi:hypothetical protein